VEKQIPFTSETPRVVVEIYGALTLKGWEQPEISAECISADDLLLEELSGEVYLRCRDTCTARVPYAAQVQVKRADGHVTIKSLEGTLELERVGGNLTLRSVADTLVKRVDGHLSAKNIAGDLRLGRVSGNVSARDVEGDFTAEGIDGNLQLEDLDGGATARVHGNARLDLDPSTGLRYAFEMDGNLVCRLPQDASVRVAIERASSIRVKLPGQDSKDLSAPHELVLGEGAAEVRLQAGGIVMLGESPAEVEFGAGFGAGTGVDFGFEEMAASIEQQVELQLESQLEMLEQQMDDLAVMLSTAGLPSEQAEQIQRRAREAGERARDRAQEKMRRAQERLQRKLETAARRAERKTQAADRAARDRRRRPGPAEATPAGATPAAAQVSQAERLIVLKMLEQQQITVEQAEQLLAALEGRSG